MLIQMAKLDTARDCKWKEAKTHLILSFSKVFPAFYVSRDESFVPFADDLFPKHADHSGFLTTFREQNSRPIFSYIVAGF